MTVPASFKYCPVCAEPVHVKDNYVLCTSCSFKLYDNPRPAACVLLRNPQGQYLLVRRAQDPGHNLWDLPGGFCIGGESLEQAARRELSEELGLELDELDYIGSYPDTYEYQGLVYDVVAGVFRTQIDNIVHIAQPDEIKELRFFALDDIPWGQLAFTSVAQVVKDVARPAGVV